MMDVHEANNQDQWVQSPGRDGASHDLGTVYPLHTDYEALDTLLEDAKHALKGRDVSHGFAHAQRVLSNVDKLLPDILAAGLPQTARHDARVLALLHDVDDHKYATQESAATLDELLDKHLTFLVPGEAKNILDCATWSGRNKPLPSDANSRLLIQLLACADRLDAMGRGGMARCELFLRHRYAGLAETSGQVLFAKQVARLAIVHAHEKLVKLHGATLWPGCADVTPSVGKDMLNKAHEQLLTSLASYEDAYRMTCVGNLARVLTRHMPFRLVGLNIEGGFPAQQLLAGTKWVNLVLVLDHPLAGDLSFREVLKLQADHKYPTLESAFLAINENRQLALYLLIVKYYANTCRNVGVHVHQFPGNASFFIDFLQRHVGMDNVTYLSDDPMWPKTRVVARARQPLLSEPMDCLISLSQCAGMNADIPVGTFLAPTVFIPFEPNSDDALIQSIAALEAKSGSLPRKPGNDGKVELSKAYSTQNDLVGDWPSIVVSPWNTAEDLKAAFEHVSAHPCKVSESSGTEQRLVCDDDVLHGNLALLQTTDIWNPASDLDVVHF